MDFQQMARRLLHILANVEVDIVSHDKHCFTHLHEQLVYMKHVLKDKDNRENMPEELTVQMCSCFIQFLEQTRQIFDILTSNIEPEQLQILELATESARCLRNVCAGCQRNQEIIAKQSTLFERLHDFIESCCLFLSKSVTDGNKTPVYVLLRCNIQMLGNLAAGNKQAGLVIWKKYFSIFSECLALRDISLSSYSCMLIHSCLLADPTICLDQLVETGPGQTLIIAILDYLIQEDNEWGLFIIELILTKPRVLHDIWNQLETSEKNLVLDIMLSQLDKASYSKPISQQVRKTVPEDITALTETVPFILKMFKDNACMILGLNQGVSMNNEDCLLLTKQLSILCTATAIQEKYTDVRRDEALLRCAINLLHCMKMIGEECNNVFSPVSKVSELENTDTSHPVCGLKRDLIRLVANMVYKNRVNQDKVREFGGISLIMDHTNIDGRNPFITQWSIFAIHNLLESNTENQAFVAGMRLEGLSDNIEQLREFGVEAELDGDHIIVRNVDVNKSVSPLSKLYKDDAKNL